MRILIKNYQRDRRACGFWASCAFWLKYAGHNFNLICFLPRRRCAAFSRTPALQFLLDYFWGQVNAWRTAVNDRAKGCSMGFAPRCHAKKGAESVTCHDDCKRRGKRHGLPPRYSRRPRADTKKAAKNFFCLRLRLRHSATAFILFAKKYAVS